MSELTKEKCTMHIDRIDAGEFQETLFIPWQEEPRGNMFAAIGHEDGSLTVAYPIPIDCNEGYDRLSKAQIGTLMQFTREWASKAPFMDEDEIIGALHGMGLTTIQAYEYINEVTDFSITREKVDKFFAELTALVGDGSDFP